MVDYRRHGPVAVLEVNNPPVNALSEHVREGLASGVARAAEDKAVSAVVIICSGRTFIAGADIREFNPQNQRGGHGIRDVGAAIEGSDKPVVAAIHGTALGGGMEIALFCHYRIAIDSALVGFPEVLLGILPMAGGTQRLPRVTDINVAMEMVTTGHKMTAAQALQHGIIDQVVKGGKLLEDSLLFASSVVGKPLGPRRLSQLPVKGADNFLPALDATMNKIKKKYKGMIAPIVCLKAVRAAVELPYQQGMQLEGTLGMELFTGAQSAAQRYLFFAERSAQKWQLPCGARASNTSGMAVKTTAVIGAGTMGSGIAVCLLRAGLPVILIEQNQQSLDKGVGMVKAMLRDAVTRGLMTADQADRCDKQLTPSTNMNQLASVDLVIEAVFESLSLKKEIFRRLDQICKPSTILCSNTSTLSIDLIASATQRPDRVVGTHFFAPAHIMRLLENVYGKHTSPRTVATVMELGKKIGKVCVLVKTCHGFVANRMHSPMNSEAVFMVEEGAWPEDVDRVMEDFGLPLGPFKGSDLAGLDIGWRIRQELAKLEGREITPATRFFRGERYCCLPDMLHSLGRLGRKTGAGWYRYGQPGSHVPLVDEDVKDVIRKHCADVGQDRQPIPTQEILERCLLSCINEGFRILEEGVAASPQDIDIIWLYGFSFPRYVGGPMFYASQVGLRTVYHRILHYHHRFPYSSHWVPSDMLRRLASAPQPLPINQWSAFSPSRL